MIIVAYLRNKLRLSRRTLWTATVGFGVCSGIGGYTFLYAHGLSYVSNEPAACANCHVMRPYYDAWSKSPHHASATCNDCHTPHDLIGKYMTKADNGFQHSKAFTLQNFNDTIRIREKNARIVERNCLRCHEDMAAGIAQHPDRGNKGPDCARCHEGAGHGPD